MSKPTHNREYLGVTITSENYREILKKEGRFGINFHTKHLKSYLQGKRTFIHGYKTEVSDLGYKSRYPIFHKVIFKEEIIK